MPATYVIPTLCALFLWAATAIAQGNVDDQLTAGMIIEADFTAARGEYLFASDSLDTPAITVRGEGITVDFSGVRLVGSDDATRPDLFSGLAVRVEGNNVTVKGLETRGYNFFSAHLKTHFFEFPAAGIFHRPYSDGLIPNSFMSFDCSAVGSV